MASVQFAATLSRQVLGSMNDFAALLGGRLPDTSLLAASLRLADAPCSPLKMDSPREATLARFAER